MATKGFRLLSPSHFLRLTSHAVLLVSCSGSLSPLSHKLKIGQEPYVVFTAEGEGGTGDLFASPVGGGAVYQVTFTRLNEHLPRLNPDGSMLAFVRGDSAAAAVWVMNLINGAERRVTEPGGAEPEGLAWSPDSRTVYVKVATGVLAAAAPPASPSVTALEGQARGAGDSALAVFVGDPVAGEVISCESGGGLCIRLGGESQPLDTAGTEPLRWGGDSVAYRVGDQFVVRPLGGGMTRALRWSKQLEHPRELTYFAPR
jgi:dipeptidyl aminopeptidase/acylaminoacyl peptidase